MKDKLRFLYLIVFPSSILATMFVSGMFLDLLKVTIECMKRYMNTAGLIAFVVGLIIWFIVYHSISVELNEEN